MPRKVHVLPLPPWEGIPELGAAHQQRAGRCVHRLACAGLSLTDAVPAVPALWIPLPVVMEEPYGANTSLAPMLLSHPCFDERLKVLGCLNASRVPQCEPVLCAHGVGQGAGHLPVDVLLPATNPGETMRVVRALGVDQEKQASSVSFSVSRLVWAGHARPSSRCCSLRLGQLA